ncbi:MAG: hypothetical protein RIM72_19680 [Alphaproteobacteria bacterium]
MAGVPCSPGLNRHLSVLFTTVLAIGLTLAGCSLDAPPPAGSEPAAPVRQADQSAAEPAGENQTVGLAPTPTVISEDNAVSPNSPVNYVALTPVPMALIWYGRTDLNHVAVTVSKAGTASRFEFRMEYLGIDCEGLLRFNGTAGHGDWQMFCSDASEAAGILVPVAGQATINGQGVDLSNRSVLFSIPLRN